MPDLRDYIEKDGKQSWDSIKDFVPPPVQQVKLPNPDKSVTFDPRWGHIGPTRRTIMAWLAEKDGKLAWIGERNASHYPETAREHEVENYLVELRDRANDLVWCLRYAGVPIGWRDD